MVSGIYIIPPTPQWCWHDRGDNHTHTAGYIGHLPFNISALYKATHKDMQNWSWLVNVSLPYTNSQINHVVLYTRAINLGEGSFGMDNVLINKIYCTQRIEYFISLANENSGT